MQPLTASRFIRRFLNKNAALHVKACFLPKNFLSMTKKYGTIRVGCESSEPVWRNGRRGRLKICLWQHSAGSSPATGIKSPVITGLFCYIGSFLYSKKALWQNRTAAEWNYVAEATRRRRRILQCRILFCCFFQSYYEFILQHSINYHTQSRRQ